MSTLTLQPKNSNSEVQARKSGAASGQSAGERSYVEVPGLGHETRDVLKQLDANLNLIEDLTGRLSFVLSEVRQTIRR